VPEDSDPTYRLMAEPGRFEVRGSDLRGVLRASYSGRSVDVETGYFEARSWIEEYAATGRSSAELEARFLKSVQGNQGVPVPERIWRGRRLRKPPESSQDFGPPPAGETPLGRYNAPGRPVLYLADSLEGVSREVLCEAHEQRWAQPFRLPGHVRLFDAQALARDVFAAGVFWALESHRSGFPDHWLGVRVADLLIDRFDGLLVPGVRGTESVRYRNVVLFSPADRWLPWVDSEEDPRLVP